MKRAARLLDQIGDDLHAQAGGHSQVAGSVEDRLSTIASWVTCIAEDLANLDRYDDATALAVLTETTMGLLGNLTRDPRWLDDWRALSDKRDALAARERAAGAVASAPPAAPKLTIYCQGEDEP